jgi:uncharacterized membrane protein YbhN (UPF0104 family)
MARSLQIALVGAGATLLVLLVRSIGLADLAADLGRFGIGFVGVVAFELLLDACNTLGWQQTLAAPPPIGFWRLFWVRQAGTAVNQLTPTASLGGEVVKAMLLRPRVTMSEALASLIAAKASFALAQVTLILLGLTAVLARLHDAPALAAGVVLGFTATLGGVIGFLVLQRRGLFSALADGAARLGMRGPRVARLRGRSAILDRHLAAFHRERPGAFARSVGWHFVGQMVGLCQLLFILGWLGTPASIATCLAIEAFALVIDSALFFIPGRIGVQEGGRVVIFTALGLSAATGLTVALIVRLNQLAVAGLGLAAFGYFSLTSTRLAGSVSET